MKIKVTVPYPRNPLATAALFRRAGSHRRCERSSRQSATHAIGRALNEMKHIP